MVVVFVAALDCAAFRSPLSGRPLSSIMLLLGGLPMASLLALALVPLISQRAAGLRGRPFWLGFEIAGLLALLIYTACAMRHSNDIREILVDALGSLGISGSLIFAAAGLVLLAPQIFMATLGGYLSEYLTRLVVESARTPHPA
jgi:hypothetical protein